MHVFQLSACHGFVKALRWNPTLLGQDGRRSDVLREQMSGVDVVSMRKVKILFEDLTHLYNLNVAVYRLAFHLRWFVISDLTARMAPTKSFAMEFINTTQCKEMIDDLVLTFHQIFSSITVTALEKSWNVRLEFGTRNASRRQRPRLRKKSKTCARNWASIVRSTLSGES